MYLKPRSNETKAHARFFSFHIGERLFQVRDQSLPEVGNGTSVAYSYCSLHMLLACEHGALNYPLGTRSPVCTGFDEP